MISLPPELLYKVLSETDIDILLPLLRSGNVPDMFKYRFEVVTNHHRKLQFWPKAFKRSHLSTIQPNKDKRYLIEFSFLPYCRPDNEMLPFWEEEAAGWYPEGELTPPDEVKLGLEKLLELNGFVYWYGKDSINDYALRPIFDSERLLFIGTQTELCFSFLGTHINLDKLRFIPIAAISLDHVTHEGELNQAISSLEIKHGKGDIIHSIGPTTYKSLRRFEVSISALSESRLSKKSKLSLSEFPPCFKMKNIDFSMLKWCRLSSVSQMENVKFPNLQDIEICLTNNGEGVHLKDIGAPKLKKFLITTDCDFAVKNVVIGDTLEDLSLENSSQGDIEIKGLDDWCVSAHTLKLREIATPFRSKSFIQGFHKVEIRVNRVDTRALNSIEIEHPNIKKLELICYQGCSTFPLIKAPNLKALFIRTFNDVELFLLSISYPNITELEFSLQFKHPKQLHVLQKLQKLKSLKMTAIISYIDVKRMELDSPAWDLPNLESFDFKYSPSRTTIDDLTIDMSTPKLESLTVQGETYAKPLDSLTLKNLPNLKKLVIGGFRELIIADNMGSTIETIKCKRLSRLQAKNLSNVQHITYIKRDCDPVPIEDVENISETVERTISGY